jgi:hypothetical protein
MTKIDLGPPQVDLLRVRAGDRNVINLKLKHGLTAVDVTGWVLEAQARHTAISPDPPALTAVVTVVDGPGGIFEIRWPGDDVRTLLAGLDEWKGVWDLQRNNDPNDPETLMAGKFTAEEDVTR